MAELREVLVAFICGCEPAREVPRPEEQQKALVEALTKPGVDVLTPEDLAEVSVEELSIPSLGLRSCAKIAIIGFSSLTHRS